jgi:hypothetical protein
MVCPYLEDIWELYLLGVLNADETQNASEHLASGCAQCGEQLRDASLAVYLLLQPSQTARPQARATAQLKRRASGR